jgi:hypothetical protein
MIKHIGRHGDKKVVIVYKTVPDQDHMCLVCYSDLMPRTYHDATMKVLESAVGQESAELADALHRNLLPDGRNILITLHKEGLIKKVPTNQVIVTPDTRNSVRLDELNKILKEMSQGAEAIKRMAEIDAQAGLRDPKKMEKIPDSIRNANLLSDNNLAENLKAQAERMKTEARGLMAEAERLLTEATAMTQSPVQETKVKKTRNASTRKVKAAQG